jgi:hypothetical protein
MIPAMATQASSSSASAIDKAAGVHLWLFVAYVGVLLLAAVLTWLVWDSGNRLQNAIRADAEAKTASANAIAEIARRDAALANEGLAKSNEEIARLNAASASLSLKVEEESRKRAEAEKALLELQRRQGQRLLDHTKFLETLRGKPKGKVELLYPANETEPYLFADQIRRWLGPGDAGDGAGWVVTGPTPLPPQGGIVRGSDLESAPAAVRFGATQGQIGIVTGAPRPTGSPIPFDDSTALGALQKALSESGAGALVTTWGIASMPPHTFVVIVGPKP